MLWRNELAEDPENKRKSSEICQESVKYNNYS